jgi:hypothetical protein
VPPRSSTPSSCLAVAIGIANPMPTLASPLPPVAICELMPTTFPCPSISGPPELPGLIAASVWITCEIVKPSGAVICRWSADTIPEVIVLSNPNGLPIAATGSPTCTLDVPPSVSGCSVTLLGSTCSTARSLELSTPATWAGTSLPLPPKRTVTLLAPSTTCALVRMSPRVSTTKPDPVAVPCSRPNGELVVMPEDCTKATPGASFA